MSSTSKRNRYLVWCRINYTQNFQIIIARNIKGVQKKNADLFKI